jgi:hypothetical protein
MYPALFPPLTAQEKEDALNKPFDFVVRTRYQTFAIIRKNFLIVMGISLIAAWYQANWWLLVVWGSIQFRFCLFHFA